MADADRPRDPVRRVVVTGTGVVSSIGTGVPAFTAGLRAGADPAGPITAFDVTGFAHAVGCEVRGFDPAAWVRRTDPAALSRADAFAVAAASMALEQAGLHPADERGVVVLGTSDGESQALEDLAATWVHEGPEHLDPATIARVPAHRLALAVAREHDLTDVEVAVVPTACAAGNYAIGYATDALRLGEAQWALAGGVDAVSRKTFAGFYRLGALSADRCRPFDADRSGILLGEGAGVLLLETLEHARGRGATVLAEVLGHGLSCDAVHMVAPDRAGIARCVAAALDDAGLAPADVDLVSAHGTGTRANDPTEVAALRDVLGPDLPPVVSVKSMLGHAQGAAGALAAVACVVALREGFIPPTATFRTADPECAVDCVPGTARDARLRVVLNDAFAVGGNNAALLLGAAP